MHNEKACRVNQVMWLQYRSPVEASMMSSHLAWTMKNRRMRKGWDKDENRKQFWNRRLRHQTLRKQGTSSRCRFCCRFCFRLPVDTRLDATYPRWMLQSNEQSSNDGVTLHVSSLQILPTAASEKQYPKRHIRSADCRVHNLDYKST